MNMNRSGHSLASRATWAVILVSSGTVVFPSFSEASDNQNDVLQLEEVIITAQFRSESVQDAPIAITAISGEQLAARNQTSVTDIAAVAPNVTLTRAGSSFGNSATASIRGIGQYDFNFGLEPGVGMYVDDVYYGVLAGAVFELSDLDRVEVLRGPQGTLAGKNSIGGSIKLFAKEPSGDGGGYIELGAGNYDQKVLRASADFAVLPDSLFLRISGVAKHRDGFFERLDYGCVNSPGVSNPGQISPGSCVIGTEGGQDLYTGRVALRWLAGDHVEDNLIVDATHDKSESSPTKLLASGPWAGSSNYVTGAESYTSYATYTGYPGTASQFTIPSVSNADGWGISNTLDIAISSGLSVKSITAVRRSTGDFATDLDASPVDVQTTYTMLSHRQFSQELRLSGQAWQDAVTWTVGGYYYDARQTISGRNDIATGTAPGGGLGVLSSPPFIDGARVVLMDFLLDDIINSDSKSVFGHVEVRPTSQLSLIGGLRYTKESKEYTFQRDVSGLPGSAVPFDPTGVQLGAPGGSSDVSVIDGAIGTYSGSNTDYRLGVNYHWAPSIMTYLQVSTGFKGGGVNPRPFTLAQLQSFEPEKLTAYELGAKMDLGGRVRANVAVFVNKYKDIQLTALACPTAPCALPVNAGDADIKGGELEVAARFGALSLDGSVSLLKFDYTRLSGVIATTGGMIAPFTPEKKYSLGAQYDIPLAGWGVIVPRLDWSFTGDMYDEAVNAPGNHVESYALLNGRLTWRNSSNTWEAALSGTNLLDKFYYVSKLTFSAPVSVQTGQPGRPREWMATIRRSF